ncbi:hypothetical protein PRIPAC_81135 [Pristionchus pacificus]|uniref:Uncharacterized protein n=1 Tax=Pristionchus pacificus TaxID=54126 RepID=A0A2A6BX70_PRIPA|nr:hypothetical protein PRIPAC_81135 [Pristionchus pacificus]|eukprot:PDM70446.1 hypothetical protein PRIPAC_46692 [Pristionchus pacificus]
MHPPKPKKLRISTQGSTVENPKVSGENGISLGTLPNDIIRLVIRVGRAPLIDLMRNISPSWNTLCINHLSVRKNNPIIESIECYLDLGDFYQIHVKVPFELQNYFGLKKWKNKYGTKKTDGVFLRRFDKDEEMERKLENFLQEHCFRAARIDIISVYTGHESWQRQLNMLTRVTANIDIGTLEITTSRSDFETTRFLLFLWVISVYF